MANIPVGGFDKSGAVGRALFGIPERVLGEIQRIGAMTMAAGPNEGRDWFPGLVLELNGLHRVVIGREITREEWRERVRRAGVDPAWLDVPTGTRFWEFSAD